MARSKACAATNKLGNPCKAPRIPYSQYCWKHAPSREAQRRKIDLGRRASVWATAPMSGRWHSKIEDYIRSRGYIHAPGTRWAGQTNIKRLSRESGIGQNALYAILRRGIEGNLGMYTLGLLCGFLQCGPSDLIYWESFPGTHRRSRSRDSLTEDYVPPAVYKRLAGQ